MEVPIIQLIWMHTIADFFLQTRWMGENKSKSNLILATHVGVYSVPFLIFGWKYALFNGLAHYVTDWISSRGTSWAHQKKSMYLFFGIIGIDQAVHLTTLIESYKMFVM